MIHKERLLKLAALLRQNAANPKGVQFDLSIWANFDLVEGQVPLDCHTSACAIGLACISGVFKEEGLGFVTKFSSIIPIYAGENDWDAVNEFFGLKGDQCDYLFVDSYYPHDQRREAKGERAVADRIAAFVASNGSTKDMVDYEDCDRGNGYAD